MKLLLLLLIVGCGRFERSITAWTGALSYKCSKHGVEYVQSDSGIAVSYNQDGTVVKCPN